ncbi:hypothetical protein SCMU_13200 [Sinomonas cyclohexanicum]|uniref:Ig-like domain-containing protein n=1 Tax=Sinomonas cyclohexanicum TaxID=322009 RepID=A0ABN6FFG1_SINCY|nr:DUF4082 domain-containing protein [Corynebacterium cyclohexanicum]BCT75478.1 hypothetical protein SCMU_13200 [Corynebacterium cyclohexanicum]
MAQSAAMRPTHRAARTPLWHAARRAVSLAVPALLVTAVLVGIPPVTTAAPAQAAVNPCSPVVSAVACENTQAGDPQSDWMISGVGDATIQGYATQMSVNVGETVQFKVNTTAKAYHFDVLRLGYYQGNGARKVAGNLLPSATLPQTQPACQTFSDTGLIDCGNWAVSASWTVPSTAVSGVYLAHLVRNDTGGSSWITFVVRNDASKSSILFQTSDETWQAYNSYGGNSLYQCTVACPPGNPAAYKGAFKVSYNRPFHTALDDSGHSWITSAEIPMIRFMEANGYDMSYQAGLDTATRGSLLLNHQVFVTSGHDEYVSFDQRATIESARDKGVSIAMFTGNELFWRTRWEASQAGPSTAGRTLVCYKDTHFNSPTDPVTWTGTYADPRFGTSGGAGNPQNALTGQFFNVNSGTTDITVPAQFAKLRLWRNTAVAGLTGSQTATLGAGLGTLGYEWDIDADNGFRPAGLFDLSSTVYGSAQVFTDYGSNTVNNQTATHSLTEYRAASGALVFGAGTVQWSWGLDGFTTGKGPDPTMQQATVNLFADMGAQPATLLAGLVATTASGDSTPPSSAITSPSAGTALGDGTAVTVKGTASDAGGGVVAGVEVSTDGGTTWHPASGTTAWTYSWIAHGNPSTTIRSRAVDDSGNLEAPGPGVSVSTSCPCSLFGTAAKPAAADAGDPSAVEVGAQFYSDVAGTVTGVRFYKAGTNTGTHLGNLWTASGTKLASVTFTGETASGWQAATFSQPVSVSAGTRYVISYYAPKGHYAQTTGYFYNNPSPPPAGSGSVDAPPLHFTRSVPGSPNGFYAYSSSSTFPNQIYDAEYYWVDPVFSPGANPVPAVTQTTPAPGVTGVAVGIAPSATFNQPVTAGSVTFTLKDATGASVAGSTALSGTPTTATFTPSSALAYSTQYTATVSGATNSTGQTMASPYSWSFTTAAPPPAPAVTTVSPTSGATGIPVSTAPSATFNQAVTAPSVTFTLKDGTGANVTGSTSLSADATTATFTPSSALSYNMTYTATVSGATNSTGQTMSSPYSWSFTTAAAPPAPNVSSANPAPGATGVSVGSPVSATFSQDVSPSSIQFALKDPSGASVTGTVSYSSATTTVTFTPSASLANNTQYTATLSGATNGTGQTMSPYSWSFTTVAAYSCPCSVFPAASTPATANSGDANAVELGMKFRTDTAGQITGVRFYKGSQNTGTHVGNLWSANGTKLATVTFGAESASGWQRAYFSAPVAVSANTTYVVSYFAPNGNYSYTANGFATAQGASPITGLANGTDGANGVYAYGTASSFPTGSYNATNYWVDAVFNPGAAAAPVVVAVSPVQGATGVAQSSTVSATFDQAVDSSSASFTLTPSGGTAVAGTTGNVLATGTYSFTPSSPLSPTTTYTASVSGVKSATGQVMASAYSWSFTTGSSGYACPCSLFGPSSVPATVTVNDSNAVELGMQFTSDAAGSVTALRFYKGAQNTGTHVGHLWTSSGTLLASVTFSGETASGWQTATLSSPVAISANITYVVSYYAPNGFYSANGGYFTTSADAPPLHGLQSTASHLNGLYRYGSSGFPTSSYNAANYWVDLVFSAS